MRNKIGESLLRAGLISDDDLRRALVEHKRTGERLGAVIVRMNLATEQQIASALAMQLGFPYVSLIETPPHPDAVVLVPEDLARKHVCIAVSLEKRLLTIAMSDPLMFSLVQALEVQSGYRVRQVISTSGEILEAIERGYPEEPVAHVSPSASGLQATLQNGDGGVPAGELAAEDRRAPRRDEEDAASIEILKSRSEAAPIRELVDLIVKGAIASGATDIHVEPTAEKGTLVRHRLDGLLKEGLDLPMLIHEQLTACLKRMAGMDIAESRLPQDGRLRATAEDGRDINFRVSMFRTLHGEKIVLRVLDPRKRVPALEELGLSATALDGVRELFRRQRGLILIAGPAGSGRSTTLAAALSSLQSEAINVVTIEDPVEYQLSGVNQTEINEKIGLTFASALRSILQQDPDVILLGEIRDADTATLAVQVAQTGKLVLSALHADDAPSAVTRLMDLGSEANGMAGAIIGVIAQRLVRRLCVHCRRQAAPSPDLLRALKMTEADAAAVSFYRSVGCDQCNHTGYRGRIGVYEVMRVTDRIRRLIAAKTSADRIREAALDGGMVSLGEDGLSKVKEGITTAEELVRVVAEIGETRTLCAGCGAAVGVDFNACPSCGKRLGGGCPHCGRALQPGWNFCPYCARSTVDAKTAARPHVEHGEHGGRALPRERTGPTKVAEFKK